MFDFSIILVGSAFIFTILHIFYDFKTSALEEEAKSLDNLGSSFVKVRSGFFYFISESFFFLALISINSFLLVSYNFLLELGFVSSYFKIFLDISRTLVSFLTLVIFLKLIGKILELFYPLFKTLLFKRSL